MEIKLKLQKLLHKIDKTLKSRKKALEDYPYFSKKKIPEMFFDFLTSKIGKNDFVKDLVRVWSGIVISHHGVVG